MPFLNNGFRIYVILVSATYFISKGGSLMRKFISFAISTILILTVFIFPSYVYASSDTVNEMTHEEFSRQLHQLIQEYWYINIEDNKNTETLETDWKDVSANRLLVKTSSNDVMDEDCGAIDKIEGYDNIHIFQYEDVFQTEAAYNYYIAQEYVEYVDIDYYIKLDDATCPDEIENAAEFAASTASLSWGSIKIGADTLNASIEELNINLPEIVVAILDSGLDSSHSFFDQSRIFDSHINTFDTEDTANPGDTTDDYWHGTHVAGIIYDNTPSNVIISPYKVLNSEGVGTYFDIADTIETAADNNVNVINISINNSTKINEMLYGRYKEAIQYAHEKNVTVVVSAGNIIEVVSGAPPANISEAITVSAVTSDYILSGDSHSGSYVDIAAPGKNINSTVPNNGYEEKSGTSQAAPFVSAAVAILKSLKPDISEDAVEKALKDNVDIPNSWKSSWGKGVVNYLKMVRSLDCDRTNTPQIDLTADKYAEIIATSNNGDTSLYYTIDGSEPNPITSILYTNPIDISDTNIKVITAIAVKDGEFYSKPSSFYIRWSKDISLQYKASQQLSIPSNDTIDSLHIDDVNIVRVNQSGTVKGLKIGETTVKLELLSGREITYNITVKYVWWQWLIVIFLFGWAWY